jgi:drug/metabolite transporter (DMT)-like permease
MMNILLFATIVLIWGSAWIMIKFQIGIVAAEASVAYRIGIAALIMFIWAVIRRLPLRFSLHDHLFIALQGALIFSTNFFLFYLAAGYLTTGLISVVLSSAAALTMLFNALRLRRPPALRVILGAFLGIFGISLIFWPELAGFTMESGAVLGLLLSIGGTVCFSLGSIVSARNQAVGISLRGSTAWAMFYGVVLLSVFVILRGKSFTFDPRLPYVASLLYLSIFGSVIAFVSYFALLGRIDAGKAAYATVLFPIVALILSTRFEGYQWTVAAFVGVLLTLVGNVFVLMQPRSVARSREKPTKVGLKEAQGL